MTDTAASTGRRARIFTGLAIVGASLLVATAIAGVGFASGSVSAAQYQYGKVTICHHTHSQKHPFRTITVSQHAWPAHQRHGDTLGPCTSSGAPTTGHDHGHGNGKGHSHGKGNDHGDDTDTTTTSSSTPPTHGNGGDNGHGNGHGKNK